jgi:hypothetical protein
MPKGNPAGYAQKSGFGALGTNPKNVFAPGFRPPRGTTKPRQIPTPNKAQPAAQPAVSRTPPIRMDATPAADEVNVPSAPAPLPSRPYRPPPTGPVSAPGTRTPGTPLGPTFDPTSIDQGRNEERFPFETPVQIADDLWVLLPVASAEPSDEEISEALEYASHMESFYEQFLPRFASEAEARGGGGTVSGLT